jgi:protein TonB
MLLLSLGVHVALVMAVQPRPGSAIPYTHVISARIVETKSEKAPDRPPDQPVPDDLSQALKLPPPVQTPAVTPVPSPVPEAPRAVVAAAPVRVDTPARAVEPEQLPSRQPTRPDESALPSIPVMIDTNWYSARQLDVQPRARHAIEPDYPVEARKSGIEGVVTLIVRVNELGEVKSVKVESGTPPGVFDASAIKAFEAGSFLPARLAGRAVRAEIRIRVTYQLND